MNAFNIRDLESLSGIKAHTIRIWEQRYSFLKPQRTDTNIRCYSNEELKHLLNIALLNKYGYKISHIDKMSTEEISTKILELTDARAVQERILIDLVNNMVDFDMEGFEKTLRSYIQSKGMERTVTQIIFPFLEKIGILWQTGHICPAQEHLVTNIIRQKIIAATELHESSLSIDRNFLLFLPEGEHHELGLLYLNYVLNARGAHTIYLGANVPLQDVAYVCDLKKPDALFVHLTGTTSSFKFDKFLQQTAEQFNGAPLLISGSLAQQYRKKVPSGIRLMKSYPELIEHIAAI